MAVFSAMKDLCCVPSGSFSVKRLGQTSKVAVVPEKRAILSFCVAANFLSQAPKNLRHV